MRPRSFIFALAPALLGIAAGVPLLLGLVPPNSWYGFRTAATLSSAANWYQLNRLGGTCMVCAGVAALLAGGCVYLLRRSIPRWEACLVGLGTGAPLLGILLWLLTA